MKNLSTLFIINLLLLVLFIVGCAPQLAIVENTSKINHPKSYYQHQDTTTQTTPVWKNYFKDKKLIALIDTAIALNLDLREAEQRLFIASSQLRLSKQLMYPSVHAAVSTGVNRFSEYSMDGVGNFDTNRSTNIREDQRIPNPVPDYYAGVITGWETGVFGKLRNRKRAAYNRFLSSAEAKHYYTTQLVAEVSRLYYELLALDTELEILRKNIALQERALEIIAIQKQSGRITELAVKQFEAQLYDFKALEATKIQQIVEVENALNTLVGRFPQRVSRKDTIDVIDLPEQIKTGVPAQLLANRPDIKEAELNLLASVNDVKAAKANLYPNISIDARVGYNAFATSLWFNPASAAFGLLGGIMAPALNRGAVVNDLRLSAIANNQAYIQFQKRYIKAVEEVSTELSRLKNYSTIVAIKSDEVRTLKEAVDISNELFLTGYATYMEVLLSRQNRLIAELALTEAQKQQFFAAINLYKAVGGGWR